MPSGQPCKLCAEKGKAICHSCEQRDAKLSDYHQRLLAVPVAVRQALGTGDLDHES